MMPGFVFIWLFLDCVLWAFYSNLIHLHPSIEHNKIMLLFSSHGLNPRDLRSVEKAGFPPSQVVALEQILLSRTRGLLVGSD